MSRISVTAILGAGKQTVHCRLEDVMENGKRITLKEIARRAETNTMAVSVVLNGARTTSGVSESTRQRILEVAAKLNYAPNAMARGLKRRRMNTLGVLFSWAGSHMFNSMYATGVLNGIADGAAEAGYRILLYTEPWVNAETSSASFADQHADGVVVILPGDESDVISGLTSLGLPVALISSVTTVEGVPYINVDSRKGMALALDHLWDLGHRRIAYLGHETYRYTTRERYEGYRNWIKEHELIPLNTMVTPWGDVEAAENNALERILSQSVDSRPTAIVTFNDEVGGKAVATATRLGLVVPDDISVVGFDDVPAAAFMTPPLTTVRQHLGKLGYEAAKLLIGRIMGTDGTDFIQSHLIAPELVVRGSTAPPRVG